MTNPSDPVPRKRRGRLGLIAFFVLIVLGLPIVLNAFFLWPSIFLLRKPMSSIPMAPLGPYASAINKVTTYGLVTIPVSGLPDAHLEIYAPIDTSPHLRPLIFWIHGGGYIGGAPNQIRGYGKVLASRGFVVVSLDYALAPEHRYPTPVLQANAALAYLRGNASKYGADPTLIFLAGDSAGAQIASQLAAIYTNPSFAIDLGITPAISKKDLRGVILNCGPYDMRTVHATGFPFLRTFFWSYTGKSDWMSFARIDELSTTIHVTKEYPSTYLTVGDADPFESQSYELDAVLRSHRVDVTSRYWTGTRKNLRHEYQFELNRKEAQTVLDDVVAFVHKKAGQS